MIMSFLLSLLSAPTVAGVQPLRLRRDDCFLFLFIRVAGIRRAADAVCCCLLSSSGRVLSLRSLIPLPS